MLIERKRTLLHLMQDGQSQGQLENRLHWCLRIAVEIAIEGDSRQGAGNSNRPLGLGSNGAYLRL
jgi:hypothetical protein